MGFIRIVDASRKQGGWSVGEARGFIYRFQEKYGGKYPGHYQALDADNVIGLIFSIENSDATWLIAARLVRGGIDVETYSTLTGARHRLPEQRWDIEKFMAEQDAARAAQQPKPAPAPAPAPAREPQSAPRREQPAPAPAQERPSSNGDDPYAHQRAVAFFLLQRRLFSKANAEAIVRQLAERHLAWAGEEVGVGFKPVGEDAYWMGLRPMSAAMAFAAILQHANVKTRHADTLPDGSRPRLRPVDLSEPAPEIRRHARPRPPGQDDTAGFPGLQAAVENVTREKLLPLLRAKANFKGKVPRIRRRGRNGDS